MTGFTDPLWPDQRFLAVCVVNPTYWFSTPQADPVPPFIQDMEYITFLLLQSTGVCIDQVSLVYVEV